MLCVCLLYIITLTSLRYLDGTGKKKKAPGKNSSEGSSQAEEATEADETQQVNISPSRPSHVFV